MNRLLIRIVSCALVPALLLSDPAWAQAGVLAFQTHTVKNQRPLDSLQEHVLSQAIVARLAAGFHPVQADEGEALSAEISRESNFSRRSAIKLTSGALLLQSIFPFSFAQKTSPKMSPPQTQIAPVIDRQNQLISEEGAMKAWKYDPDLDVSQFKNLLKQIINANPAMVSKFAKGRAAWSKYTSMLHAEGKYFDIHSDPLHGLGVPFTGNRPYVSDMMGFPGVSVARPQRQVETLDTAPFQANGFWGRIMEGMRWAFTKAIGGIQFYSKNQVEENWLQDNGQAFIVRESYTELEDTALIQYRAGVSAWLHMWTHRIGMNQRQAQVALTQEKVKRARALAEATGTGAEDYLKLQEAGQTSEANLTTSVDEINSDRIQLGLSTVHSAEDLTKPIVFNVDPQSPDWFQAFNEGQAASFETQIAQLLSIQSVTSQPGEMSVLEQSTLDDFPTLEQLASPIAINTPLATTPKERLMKLQLAALKSVDEEILRQKMKTTWNAGMHIDLNTMPYVVALLNYSIRKPTRSTILSLKELVDEIHERMEELSADIATEQITTRASFETALTHQRAALNQILKIRKKIQLVEAKAQTDQQVDKTYATTVTYPEATQLELAVLHTEYMEQLVEAVKAWKEMQMWTVSGQTYLMNEVYNHYVESIHRLDPSLPVVVNPQTSSAETPAALNRRSFLRGSWRSAGITAAVIGALATLLPFSHAETFTAHPLVATAQIVVQGAPAKVAVDVTVAHGDTLSGIAVKILRAADPTHPGKFSQRLIHHLVQQISQNKANHIKGDTIISNATYHVGSLDSTVASRLQGIHSVATPASATPVHTVVPAAQTMAPHIQNAALQIQQAPLHATLQTSAASISQTIPPVPVHTMPLPAAQAISHHVTATASWWQGFTQPLSGYSHHVHTVFSSMTSGFHHPTVWVMFTAVALVAMGVTWGVRRFLNAQSLKIPKGQTLGTSPNGNNGWRSNARRWRPIFLGLIAFVSLWSSPFAASIFSMPLFLPITISLLLLLIPLWIPKFFNGFSLRHWVYAMFAGSTVAGLLVLTGLGTAVAVMAAILVGGVAWVIMPPRWKRLPEWLSHSRANIAGGVLFLVLAQLPIIGRAIVKPLVADAQHRIHTLTSTPTDNFAVSVNRHQRPVFLPTTETGVVSYVNSNVTTIQPYQVVSTFESLPAPYREIISKINHDWQSIHKGSALIDTDLLDSKEDASAIIRIRPNADGIDGTIGRELSSLQELFLNYQYLKAFADKTRHVVGASGDNVTLAEQQAQLLMMDQKNRIEALLLKRHLSGITRAGVDAIDVLPGTYVTNRTPVKAGVPLEIMTRVRSDRQLINLSFLREDGLGLAELLGKPGSSAELRFSNRKGTIYRIPLSKVLQVTSNGGVLRQSNPDLEAFTSSLQTNPTFGVQHIVSVELEVAGNPFATDSTIGFNGVFESPDAKEPYRPALPVNAIFGTLSLVSPPPMDLQHATLAPVLQKELEATDELIAKSDALLNVLKTLRGDYPESAELLKLQQTFEAKHLAFQMSRIQLANELADLQQTGMPLSALSNSSSKNQIIVPASPALFDSGLRKDFSGDVSAEQVTVYGPVIRLRMQSSWLQKDVTPQGPFHVYLPAIDKMLDFDQVPAIDSPDTVYPGSSLILERTVTIGKDMTLEEFTRLFRAPSKAAVSFGQIDKAPATSEPSQSHLTGSELFVGALLSGAFGLLHGTHGWIQWLVGFGTAVLIHELGHGIEAWRRNPRAWSIPFLSSKGITWLQRSPDSKQWLPIEDFAVQRAGPRASLWLSIFGAVGIAVTSLFGLPLIWPIAAWAVTAASVYFMGADMWRTSHVDDGITESVASVTHPSVTDQALWNTTPLDESKSDLSTSNLSVQSAPSAHDVVNTPHEKLAKPALSELQTMLDEQSLTYEVTWKRGDPLTYLTLPQLLLVPFRKEIRYHPVKMLMLLYKDEVLSHWMAYWLNAKYLLRRARSSAQDKISHYHVVFILTVSTGLYVWLHPGIMPILNQVLRTYSIVPQLEVYSESWFLGALGWALVVGLVWGAYKIAGELFHTGRWIQRSYQVAAAVDMTNMEQRFDEQTGLTEHLSNDPSESNAMFILRRIHQSDPIEPSDPAYTTLTRYLEDFAAELTRPLANKMNPEVPDAWAIFEADALFEYSRIHQNPRVDARFTGSNLNMPSDAELWSHLEQQGIKKESLSPVEQFKALRKAQLYFAKDRLNTKPTAALIALLMAGLDDHLLANVTPGRRQNIATVLRALKNRLKTLVPAATKSIRAYDRLRPMDKLIHFLGLAIQEGNQEKMKIIEETLETTIDPRSPDEYRAWVGFLRRDGDRQRNIIQQQILGISAEPATPLTQMKPLTPGMLRAITYAGARRYIKIMPIRAVLEFLMKVRPDTKDENTEDYFADKFLLGPDGNPTATNLSLHHAYFMGSALLKRIVSMFPFRPSLGVNQVVVDAALTVTNRQAFIDIAWMAAGTDAPIYVVNVSPSLDIYMDKLRIGWDDRLKALESEVGVDLAGRVHFISATQDAAKIQTLLADPSTWVFTSAEPRSWKLLGETKGMLAYVPSPSLLNSAWDYAFLKVKSDTKTLMIENAKAALRREAETLEQLHQDIRKEQEDTLALMAKGRLRSKIYGLKFIWLVGKDRKLSAARASLIQRWNDVANLERTWNELPLFLASFNIPNAVYDASKPDEQLPILNSDFSGRFDTLWIRRASPTAASTPTVDEPTSRSGMIMPSFLAAPVLALFSTHPILVGFGILAALILVIGFVWYRHQRKQRNQAIEKGDTAYARREASYLTARDFLKYQHPKGFSWEVLRQNIAFARLMNFPVEPLLSDLELLDPNKETEKDAYEQTVTALKMNHNLAMLPMIRQKYDNFKGNDRKRQDVRDILRAIHYTTIFITDGGDGKRKIINTRTWPGRGDRSLSIIKEIVDLHEKYSKEPFIIQNLAGGDGTMAYEKALALSRNNVVIEDIDLIQSIRFLTDSSGNVLSFDPQGHLLQSYSPETQTLWLRSSLTSYRSLPEQWFLNAIIKWFGGVDIGGRKKSAAVQERRFATLPIDSPVEIVSLIDPAAAQYAKEHPHRLIFTQANFRELHRYGEAETVNLQHYSGIISRDKEHYYTLDTIKEIIGTGARMVKKWGWILADIDGTLNHPTEYFFDLYWRLTTVAMHLGAGGYVDNAKTRASLKMVPILPGDENPNTVNAHEQFLSNFRSSLNDHQSNGRSHSNGLVEAA